MTDEQRDIIELRRALDAYRRENDALRLENTQIKVALEKVVAAWDNGAGFALVEACLHAKKVLEAQKSVDNTMKDT